jgi:hypothetical protein
MIGALELRRVGDAGWHRVGECWRELDGGEDLVVERRVILVLDLTELCERSPVKKFPTSPRLPHKRFHALNRSVATWQPKNRWSHKRTYVRCTTVQNHPPLPAHPTSPRTEKAAILFHFISARHSITH